MNSHDDTRLLSERFPRSSQYHPEWVMENAFGANALWLTEWLTSAVDLKPGMQVMDLGCGRAKSSVFLAREFGVQVWAADLWISAAENMERIRDAGVEESVFPIGRTEIETLKADGGQYLGYVRIVARRRGDAKLEDYCWPDTMRSYPVQYERKPLLRERES